MGLNIQLTMKDKIIELMGEKGQFLVDWAELNDIGLDAEIVNAFLLGQEWALNQQEASASGNSRK